ncbi:MAG: arylsulfatase [Planctomycetota bacterium]|nr:arylsulfatase [Planctomycetota bacterium]
MQSARPALLLLTLVGPWLWSCVGPPAPHAPRTHPTPRPHIVVILADDLGPGDLSCLNPRSRIRTPNLDRLREAGASFTDAHSPSAVCTPTRYGILTGRYCWRTRLKNGVLWTDDPLLIEEGRPTSASELRKAGYHTAFVGKWHLGLGSEKPTDWSGPLDAGPHTVGFEESVGIPSSLDIPPYVWFRNGVGDPPPTGVVEGSIHRRQGGDGFWRAGAIAEGFEFADVLPRSIDESIDIVRRHAIERPDRPLLLQLWLSAPHTPWLPSETWRGTSGAGRYGDFVQQIDGEIGRLLTALEMAGMSDDTLVVFTSDNGAHWPVADIDRYRHDAHLGRRGQKADIHEAGHRIPMLVRWPGVIEPGTTFDEPVCLTDLHPTCLAAGGVRSRLDDPSTGDLDGVDLVPLLRNGDRSTLATRPGIVHHSLDGMFAVRVGDWKLIEGLGSGGFTDPRRREPASGEIAVQLYDLDRDPGETRNLAAERPDVVVRLQAILAAIRDPE